MGVKGRAGGTVSQGGNVSSQPDNGSLYSGARILVLGVYFFFQAEDGMRALVRSRGLGDVYKRQSPTRGRRSRSSGSSRRRRRSSTSTRSRPSSEGPTSTASRVRCTPCSRTPRPPTSCLLYTSDAADDPLCVHLGGRRNIKKKTNTNTNL